MSASPRRPNLRPENKPVPEGQGPQTRTKVLKLETCCNEVKFGSLCKMAHGLALEYLKPDSLITIAAPDHAGLRRRFARHVFQNSIGHN